MTIDSGRKGEAVNTDLWACANCVLLGIGLIFAGINIDANKERIQNLEAEVEVLRGLAHGHSAEGECIPLPNDDRTIRILPLVAPGEG